MLFRKRAIIWQTSWSLFLFFSEICVWEKAIFKIMFLINVLLIKKRVRHLNHYVCLKISWNEALKDFSEHNTLEFARNLRCCLILLMQHCTFQGRVIGPSEASQQNNRYRARRNKPPMSIIRGWRRFDKQYLMPFFIRSTSAKVKNNLL